MAKPRPEPFRVHVPGADLADLRERLMRWRRAADFGNDDWRYGLNGDFLARLVEHWLDRYDWRAHELRMNELDHFRVRLDDVPIHFVLRRGRGPAPIPLVLTHGWPWTFWDFRHVIGPLADPEAHGGDPEDAFDVVVPSLPGFVFSSPLERTGVGFARTAALWDRLMREVLGYTRYAAQGGDWGALVTAAIGHLGADHVIGVHESMGGFLDLDYAAIPWEECSPEERDWPERVARKTSAITSHMAVHTHDPQTLAFALEDSPVGLAAWIVERRRAWSDCDGDVERRFSLDDLITTVSLYWHTRTIGTSLRFYWESMGPARWQPVRDVSPAVPVPSAFAILPEDNVLVPRRVAERHANVQQWTILPRGGHFGPAEEPELIVEDVRRFFRTLRGR
ncbi:MAG: epoxide hydrolase [Spirochaetaceae bacterium]|nr:epoxide hydrolase [Myxococcales bacterium]MCB9723095.1 epoxide hydrolase [Spirochaetaceae bacterium]